MQFVISSRQARCRHQPVQSGQTNSSSFLGGVLLTVGAMIPATLVLDEIAVTRAGHARRKDSLIIEGVSSNFKPEAIVTIAALSIPLAVPVGVTAPVNQDAKAANPAATGKAEVPATIVSLSERALQQLAADKRRLGQTATTPDQNATTEQQQLQSTLTSYDYEIAQTRVDATAFAPKLQAYVNTINNPKATDDQKLQAYIGFNRLRKSSRFSAVSRSF